MQEDVPVFSKIIVLLLLIKRSRVRSCPAEIQDICGCTSTVVDERWEKRAKVLPHVPKVLFCGKICFVLICG